ncbi:MAG: hypothetical protein ABIL11_19090 [Chloroflexota bacterium]
MTTKARNSLFAFTAVIIFSLLACNLPASSTDSDPTKVAMQIQLTLQAIQNATLVAQPAQAGQATQGVQPLPTYTLLPTYTPPQINTLAVPTAIPATPPQINTLAVPPSIPATPTQSLDERMKSAKILVYEDLVLSNLGPWVKDTLDMMGLNYKYDGDAMGRFLGDLNSSTPWDLIIVAAENRDSIQGEFWDVIAPKVIQDKTALIVEMWYLSDTANGRIMSLTAPCGITFQSVRKDVDSIYILDSKHPVFSTPNSGFSLIHYSPVWFDKGGDYIRLTSGSNAILLAGGHVKEKSSYGLIATCFDGRVIFQTFSNHDYKRSDIQMLWQNYITNTLQKHFEAVP